MNRRWVRYSPLTQELTMQSACAMLAQARMSSLKPVLVDASGSLSVSMQAVQTCPQAVSLAPHVTTMTDDSLSVILRRVLVRSEAIKMVRKQLCDRANG